MGEAKQRKLRAADTHHRLTAEFLAVGIDPTAFGFYDQTARQAQEQRDPAYLENTPNRS